jgi:hypothetical protein
MSHPATLKTLRKTIGHAATIRNAAIDLLALETQPTVDGEKQRRLTHTIEQRVIALVRDLGMAHVFQQEIKQ